MSADVDVAAIALMESLGVLSLLVAFLFFRRHRKITSKQKEFKEAAERGAISEMADGKCYSSEWVLDNIVFKPKKLVEGTPLLLAIVSLSLAGFYFLIGPHIFESVLNLGYSIIILVIGIALLLWTDAFQAYSYAGAIQKVRAEELDREDEDYLELAVDATRKAYARFISLGIAFALFGPLVPQIFSSVVGVFVLYASIYFEASEVSMKFIPILGAFIVLIIPGIMLFLPELMGRVLVKRGKTLVRKIVNRVTR